MVIRDEFEMQVQRSGLSSQEGKQLEIGQNQILEGRALGSKASVLCAGGSSARCAHWWCMGCTGILRESFCILV